MSAKYINTSANYLPGLDVTKFLMAVLLIAAHTGYLKGTIAGVLVGPLIGLAIPMFFALSAYLFFRKVFSESDSRRQRFFLSDTVKRLLILFCCWYVLMLPMIILKGTYISSIPEAIYTLFLTSAMWGYWFIKALIINTVLFFLFRRKSWLILLTFIAFVVYFYCAYNAIFHYNKFLERLQPYYSFYYHMAYFSAGVWYARYSSRVEHLSKQCTITLMSVWCLFYVVSLIFEFEWLPPIFRIFSFALLFPSISKVGGGKLWTIQNFAQHEYYPLYGTVCAYLALRYGMSGKAYTRIVSLYVNAALCHKVCGSIISSFCDSFYYCYA